MTLGADGLFTQKGKPRAMLRGDLLKWLPDLRIARSWFSVYPNGELISSLS